MPIHGCSKRPEWLNNADRLNRFLCCHWESRLFQQPHCPNICYRCIFGAPPPADAVPSCSQAGVLGVLAGVIGSLQATEAIKYLLGIGDLLTNTLLTYNALTMEFRKVQLNRNPDCPLCGEAPQITELRDEEQAVCDVKYAELNYYAYALFVSDDLVFEV